MLKSLNFKHKEDTTKIITLTSTTTQWFQMQQFSFWIDLKFLKTLFLLNRKKMNINIYGLHHLNLKELSTVYQLKCQIVLLSKLNTSTTTIDHPQQTLIYNSRTSKAEDQTNKYIIITKLKIPHNSNKPKERTHLYANQSPLQTF